MSDFFVNASVIKPKHGSLVSELTTTLCGNADYVNASGSDVAVENIIAPWKKIIKVNLANLLPGDRMHFAEEQTLKGQLTLDFNRVGNLDHLIIFDSYENGRTLIVPHLNRQFVS